MFLECKAAATFLNLLCFFTKICSVKTYVIFINFAYLVLRNQQDSHSLEVKSYKAVSIQCL